MALATSVVAALVVMVLPATVSATSQQRRPVSASAQTSGSTAAQMSVVSMPVGPTTEWEVPADVEYVAVNLCAGAPSSGATSPCATAKVKVTEGQVLSTLVGTMGRPSSILDNSRPAGSRALIAIGPASTHPVVGSTDVTEVAMVSPVSGSGSDGSASFWLPPAPVHAVARAVAGDGSALNVFYTLHVVQNAAPNVYRGVGPALFPTDITGVEYSIDGGSTWQHSGGPPPAAGSAGTFSIRNLTPDTAYTVQVRAVNGAGPGIQGSSTATTSRLPTQAATIATTTTTTSTTTTAAPPTTAATTTTAAAPTTLATTTTAAPPTTQVPSTSTTSTSAAPSTTSTSVVPSTTTTSTSAAPTTAAAAPTTATPSPTSAAPSTSTDTSVPPASCSSAASGSWYQDAIGAVGSTLTITPCVPSGTTPVGFAITAGALPAGVVLDNDAGVISGTPTESASGAGEVTLTATVANGATVESTFRIGINQMGHALGYPNRNIAAVGQPVTITPTQALTTGPVEFTLVSGTMPAGLELDTATGVISGTPTTPAERPAPLVVRSDDVTGADEASFVIVVTPADSAVPWIRYPDNAYQVVGEQVRVRPMTSDLPTTVTFELSGGRLPSGLDFDAATGAVSGAATGPGSTSGLLVTAVGRDRSPLASTALDLTLIDALGQPVADEPVTPTNWWWLALLGALLAAGLIGTIAIRRRHEATTT